MRPKQTWQQLWAGCLGCSFVDLMFFVLSKHISNIFKRSLAWFTINNCIIRFLWSDSCDRNCTPHLSSLSDSWTWRGCIAAECWLQPWRCLGFCLALLVRRPGDVHARGLRDAGDRQLSREERLECFDEELGERVCGHIGSLWPKGWSSLNCSKV